jgi:hypothetical protein
MDEDFAPNFGDKKQSVASPMHHVTTYFFARKLFAKDNMTVVPPLLA